jgi:hypothetical protein
MATYLEGICYSEHGRNTRKRRQYTLHSLYSSHAGKLNILVPFSLPSPCLKETDNSRTEKKNGCKFSRLKATC